MEQASELPPNAPKIKLKLPPIGFYFKRYILYETKTVRSFANLPPLFYLLISDSNRHLLPQRLFLIGRNAAKTVYRILKVQFNDHSRLKCEHQIPVAFSNTPLGLELQIDRTQPTGLSIVEDEAIYSRKDITVRAAEELNWIGLVWKRI